MTQIQSQPRVSIILPAFNASKHIEEAFDSVRAQTFEDWELVVADDGSDDGTWALAQRAADADPRIMVLRVPPPTGHPGRARNAAMARAQGNFFAFLDADDRWQPNKLELQLTYLDSHQEAGGVCCWIETFGDAERMRNERYRMKTGRVCRQSELLDGMPFCTSSLMIRRACYHKIGPMTEDRRLRMGEDAEYFARLLKDFEVHRIPKALVQYRLAPLDDPSVTVEMLQRHDDMGWKLTDVYGEQGLFTQAQLKRRRSHLYYERARINMRMLNRPFRGDLIRSIRAGHPSWQTLLTFALCFLPTPILSRLLMTMQGALNGLKSRWFK